MDLRLDVSVLEHPKVRQLERLLGTAGPLGLIALWCWARVHAPSGLLRPTSAADLARWARYAGEPAAFLSALCTAPPGHKRGLLIPILDGSYRLAGWDERQPLAMRDSGLSSADARRKAAQRAGKASAAARAARGITRDPATGRFPSASKPPSTPPGTTPQNGPVSTERLRTDHRTEPRTASPNASPNPSDVSPCQTQRNSNAPERPLSFPAEPPTPRPGTGPRPWRYQNPEQTGPLPSPAGEALARLHLDDLATYARIRARACLGPISPRDRAAAQALADRLAARGVAVPPIEESQPPSTAAPPELSPEPTPSPSRAAPAGLTSATTTPQPTP